MNVLMSKYLIHSNGYTKCLNNLLFIQVISDSMLPSNSKKKRQFENMKEVILNSRLLKIGLSITGYKLFMSSDLKNNLSILVNAIKEKK